MCTVEPVEEEEADGHDVDVDEDGDDYVICPLVLAACWRLADGLPRARGKLTVAARGPVDMTQSKRGTWYRKRQTTRKTPLRQNGWSQNDDDDGDDDGDQHHHDHCNHDDADVSDDRRDYDRR